MADDKRTSAHYVRLRGLPYSAKEQDIRNFFEGLEVSEVQLVQTPDGRASGEAYVSFNTPTDASSALQQDRNTLGNRYIEVFRVTEPEFARIRSNGSAGGVQMAGRGRVSSSTVRIRGLPFSCTRHELEQFFDGITMDEVIFGKEPGEGGRPTGEGYVRFETPEAADKAMKKNGLDLGKRYLELFRIDNDQFERYRRQMTTGVGYAPGPPDPWATGWYQPQDNVYGWDSSGMPVRGRTAPPPLAQSYRGAMRPSQYPRSYDQHPRPYDYHGRVYGDTDGGVPPQSYGATAAAYDAYAQSYYQAQQPFNGGAGGDIGGPHKVYIRGLPFKVTPQQITAFFGGLTCTDVKLGYLPDGRVSGDGIVEFSTPEDADAALRKDRQVIGTRYIEVFSSSMIKGAPGTTYRSVLGGGSGAAVPGIASSANIGPTRPPTDTYNVW